MKESKKLSGIPVLSSVVDIEKADLMFLKTTARKGQGRSLEEIEVSPISTIFLCVGNVLTSDPSPQSQVQFKMAAA